MPSFDIVNEVDLQEVDNAVNNTAKEVRNRYDFRASETEIALDKKEKRLTIVTEDDMKMRAIQEMLGVHLLKRKISPKVLDAKDPEPTAKGMLKREVKLVEGLDSDKTRAIVKLIKEMKLKVEAKIQDEKVRVTAKKIDDLQAVIAMLRGQDLGVPLQFVNMKS